MLKFFIAFRFLFKSFKVRSLSFFAVVSVLSIAFSILLFVLIDALINGLSFHLKKTFLGFEAPLSVQTASEDVSMVQSKLEEFAADHPQFDVHFVRVGEFDGLIQSSDGSRVVIRARSVDDDFFKIKKNELDVSWFGEFGQKDFIASDQALLLGESLIQKLGFVPLPDDRITLIHPYADIGPGGEMEPAQVQLAVAGLFTTGRIEFDDSYVLLPRDVIQNLAGEGLVEHSFYIFIGSVESADLVKEAWNTRYSNGRWDMQTWLDKNKALFKAIRLERFLYFAVLALVVLISLFNLAGIVSVFALGKSREAGVLRSLGWTRRDLSAVFSRLGFLLGTCGAVLGVGGSLALIAAFKLSDFSLPRAYGFTELPLQVNGVTIVFLLAATPLLSLCVAVMPARVFMKRKISETLRSS